MAWSHPVEAHCVPAKGDRHVRVEDAIRHRHRQLLAIPSPAAKAVAATPKLMEKTAYKQRDVRIAGSCTKNISGSPSYAPIRTLSAVFGTIIKNDRRESFCHLVTSRFAVVGLRSRRAVILASS